MRWVQRWRWAYFRNQPCAQLALWGEAKNISHNLLMLWDERDDETSLRLVRPIGLGSARRGVPIDLSVDLPRTRTDFESTKFEIADEELDETEVNYDEEEDESGGSASTGARLTDLRELLQLTQTELAKKAGVPSQRSRQSREATESFLRNL